MTFCFVYKVMGLIFYERINTHSIYRFELAQVVARRITKPQRIFLGSNLTGCSFFYSFFYFSGGGGGGSYFIILFMSYFFFSFFFYYYFFIPLTCIRHTYIKTSVTTQTTVNSEIYANSVTKTYICDVKICD